MNTVGEIYKLRNLIKEPTCFQNSDNPTCTDLVLTNKPLSFKSSDRDRELSDFYKMIAAGMKTHFPKMKVQVARYPKYTKFHNETFLELIRHELNLQEQFLNQKEINTFSTIYTEIFNKHALKKNEIYDLTTSLLLIMKFLSQSRQGSFTKQK